MSELTAVDKLLRRKRSLLRKSGGKFHDEKLTAAVGEFVKLEKPTEQQIGQLSEKLDAYEDYLSKRGTDSADRLDVESLGGFEETDDE